MFCVIRSSLLLAAFAQACEGKCPLFHYGCQNFSFKNVHARASLLMGKEGSLAGRSSRHIRSHGEEFIFFSHRIICARYIPDRCASNQLHTAGNNVWASVFDQKMDMIAGNHVIQHRKTEALFGFEHPAQITLSIARKLQEKLFLMATVSDVPNVTGKKMTVGSRIDG
jgi:hypothetical protein